MASESVTVFVVFLKRPHHSGFCGEFHFFYRVGLFVVKYRWFSNYNSLREPHDIGFIEHKQRLDVTRLTYLVFWARAVSSWRRSACFCSNRGVIILLCRGLLMVAGCYVYPHCRCQAALCDIPIYHSQKKKKLHVVWCKQKETRLFSVGGLPSLIEEYRDTPQKCFMSPC